MTNGPTFSMSEAVEACSCSRSTLRRKLKTGAIDGATQDDTGQWRIPIAALVAAGLMAPTTKPADPEPPALAMPVKPDELERLREQNAELRRRAEVAEAELRRADQTIEAQAQALRMLEAGPPVTAPDTPDTTPEAATEPPKGRFRRWFLGE